MLCVQASGNVAGLCNWAEAMCTYHKVAKEVEPKIEALHAAEVQLKIAIREKDAALGQLLVVQNRLDAMQVRPLPHIPRSACQACAYNKHPVATYGQVHESLVSAATCKTSSTPLSAHRCCCHTLHIGWWYCEVLDINVSPTYNSKSTW